MLRQLKYILNSFTDEELEDMDLWIDASIEIEQIIVEDTSIDLITENAEVKIDDYIDKEKRNK